ncbi:hypothetical protein MKX03_029557 [Papaver bracteatum]|nr:hypothetical protein MKX03_029557 [Papaver bracteatum]
MGPSNGVLHPALKSMKRTIRKKREFIGWGSTSLIEFLISIDRDPNQTCSLIDVSNIINEYITKNQLTDRIKKKRVVCDERLLSILGKRTVNRTKILDLLEPHLLEYQDSSEEDELGDNLEEGEGASNPCKKRRRGGGGGGGGWTKPNGTIRIKVAPHSCFASIVTQNIKLVYLKRSFIQNLTKELDTFDGKVVGSFVRVKRDPNDYVRSMLNEIKFWTQKASDTCDSSTGIILQLSNRSDGVQIRMLSDDDFTEEECEDLRQPVKDGQVKRLTTWDLEGKVRVLHQDITYHWIEKELALLRNLIDRANSTRYEYLERRALLESPSERERLMQEVPLVIADKIEVEPPAELNLSRIPESLNVARKETSSSPKDGEILPSGPNSKSSNIAFAVVQSDLITNKQNKSEQVVEEEQNQPRSKGIQASMEDHKQRNETNNLIVNQDQDIVVIDLDDDEDACGNLIFDHPESSIWYYLDRSGKVQGPFSMSWLKVSKSRDLFKSDLRVLKTGQTSEAAILLTDAISQVFPSR